MARIILLPLAASGIVLVSATAVLATGQRSSALSGAYLGSYTATLSVQQAAARGDARLAGRYTLVLAKNGTYRTGTPLDGVLRGRLAALPGKRLRFYNDSGCIEGGFERPQGGVYRWSVNGRRLTLRLVNEGPCTGRTQTLTWPAWKRK